MVISELERLPSEVTWQGQRINYVRVSSFDQNPERQQERIVVGKVCTDKTSGKDTQRLELERLLAFVSEGYTVVVHSMDTLACSPKYQPVVQTDFEAYGR